MSYREYGNPPCKIVYIIMGDGDIHEWIEDMKIAVAKKLPIILVKGTDICDKMIAFMSEKTKLFNTGKYIFSLIHLELQDLLENGHFYALESNKSEDIAAFAHFFLSVTPY